MIGDVYDDGRYRQVFFHATTPNCKWEFTRYAIDSDGNED
jgi:hypothetical protein